MRVWQVSIAGTSCVTSGVKSQFYTDLITRTDKLISADKNFQLCQKHWHNLKTFSYVSMNKDGKNGFPMSVVVEVVGGGCRWCWEWSEVEMKTCGLQSYDHDQIIKQITETCGNKSTNESNDMHKTNKSHTSPTTLKVH